MGGRGWCTLASCDHSPSAHAQPLMFQQAAPPSLLVSIAMEETGSVCLGQYLSKVSNNSPDCKFDIEQNTFRQFLNLFILFIEQC